MTLDGIVIDAIPSASNHAGCRLAFAPDGTLFVTAGDALQSQNAQDVSSLAGKNYVSIRMAVFRRIILSPIPPVYSLGHRNPQGLDWDPDTGLLYATEHGPSGFDGAPGGDEINLIQAGGNYGWPLVSHEETLEGTIPPLITFTPAEAPAAAIFYSGGVFPQYAGDFFFGALRGEGLVRVRHIG
jgi:glucose/arabinose dehydrogenase